SAMRPHSRLRRQRSTRGTGPAAPCSARQTFEGCGGNGPHPSGQAAGNPLPPPGNAIAQPLALTSDEQRGTSRAWSSHAATKYVWLGDESRGRWFAMGTPPDVEAPIWEQDWSLEPFPFKIYETVPRVAIPRELAPSPIPALQAIADTAAGVSKAFPDRATVARIGLLSNGLLGRQFKRRGTTGEFRTAGATGARYHLELYFVCADLPDLPAGIYHYAADDHSLGRLRAGDYRAALAAAAGGESDVALSPVVLAMTSTFWRNAWRYKARAYRHAFWDAGTAFANVLAVAAASGLPAKLVLG